MTSLSRNCHILQNVSKLSLATLSQEHLVSIQACASGTDHKTYHNKTAGAEVGFTTFLLCGFTTATAMKQLTGKQDFPPLHRVAFCQLIFW